MTAMSFMIVISIILVLVGYLLFDSKIYSGVSVAGIDLSRCSQNEAAQLLSVLERTHRDKQITLYYDEMVFRADGTDIDFSIDIEETINEAWSYGRRGLWWDRIKEIYTASQYGYESSLKIKYDELKLAHLIEQWQSLIELPPRNATLSVVSGRIIPEQQGRRLGSDGLRDLVLGAFMKTEDDAVALPVTTLYPEITVTEMGSAGIREALSVYSTVFNSQDANRSMNIKIAAWKVNGYILYPGKIFSFNSIVGPREKMYGFKEALEIMDGELVLGVGGGICQLSSTLYNAALLANLEVVERHNHSKPLSYIPLGRDATVVFGGLDFKFANNTSSPIMIMAEVQGDKLLVGIFGQHSLAEVVEIVSIDQEVIPQAILKKKDKSLYLGEFKIEKQGKPGYVITTLRIVRLGKVETKREVLSKDSYLPDDTVMKVGVQMPPFSQGTQ